MVRLLFVLFFLPLPLFADDLPQIRKDYYAAVNSLAEAEKLYKSLKDRNSAEPVIMAYFGSTQALRAKHTFNPYKKITYLKSGLKVLNAAVDRSSQNLEIRFLRFTLEHYIPSFLGFSEHLDTDRKKIIELCKGKKFGSMDKSLLLNLLSFMKETKRCSPQEIAILSQAINNG